MPPDEVGRPQHPQEDVCLRAGRAEDAARLAVVFVSAWRHSYHRVVSEASLQGLDENEVAAPHRRVREQAEMRAMIHRHLSEAFG